MGFKYLWCDELDHTSFWIFIALKLFWTNWWYLLSFLALYNLFIALGFLAFLCGVYLLKNNSAVHRIALPVAVVSIFSFPAGTIAGGLYLWQRHENS